MTTAHHLCGADFMPELYRIEHTRGWEAECSFGLISIAVCGILLRLAIQPTKAPDFLGWEWMTPAQRSGFRVTIAFTILLAGIGGYHHDLGWLLTGLLLSLVAVTGWYYGCQPPHGGSRRRR